MPFARLQGSMCSDFLFFFTGKQMVTTSYVVTKTTKVDFAFPIFMQIFFLASFKRGKIGSLFQSPSCF